VSITIYKVICAFRRRKRGFQEDGNGLDRGQNLVPSQYDEVKMGYRKVYELLAGKWLGDTSVAAQISHVELLMSLIAVIKPSLSGEGMGTGFG